MAKVKCVQIDIGNGRLTIGRIYEIDRIDYAGDIWIKEDDIGDSYFLYPHEAEIISED